MNQSICFSGMGKTRRLEWKDQEFLYIKRLSLGMFSSSQNVSEGVWEFVRKKAAQMLKQGCAIRCGRGFSCSQGYRVCNISSHVSKIFCSVDFMEEKIDFFLHIRVHANQFWSDQFLNLLDRLVHSSLRIRRHFGFPHAGSGWR